MATALDSLMGLMAALAYVVAACIAAAILAAIVGYGGYAVVTGSERVGKWFRGGRS